MFFEKRGLTPFLAMKTFLQQYTEETYALLRMVAGAMFLFHGVQKTFGVMTEFVPAVGSQIWIGGLIELLGGLAIALGFGTRIAAFLCSGTMAVAYTQFHWKLDLGAKFFPGVNEGELALLYSFLFLFIACRGPGKWSLDRD